MKYCRHCGKEVMDEAIICPNCGCATDVPNTLNSSEIDEPSMGLNIVGLLIPIVGLILFLVYHDKTPRKAKEIGKFALIGCAIACVLWLLTFCSTLYML